MKSSTLNHPNIQALRSDKRFEALVKQEMIEHQHILSCYHKEIQDLRDSLRFSMDKFESLSKRNEQDLSEFKAYILHHICLIKDKIIADSSAMDIQKKTIEDLYKQLLDFQIAYSSKSDVEKFRKGVDDQIKDATTSNINSFQDCQRELKGLVQSLREDAFRLKCETEEKFCAVQDSIKNGFNVTKIDRQGVLKEIRVWAKAIFIVEKKIENIYTLIERTNKRGEVCHKPE